MIVTIYNPQPRSEQRKRERRRRRPDRRDRSPRRRDSRSPRRSRSRSRRRKRRARHDSRERRLMSSEESSEFKRAALPIDGVQKELLDTIAKNQVVVITGDTGSGKSTQLAQLLDGSGAYTGRGRAIVVTQPRRIGAVSLARRVAQEMGTRVGDCVGYTIRFDDQTSERTRIKYATDGIVLRECLQDSVLDRYSVVILDEAHERSLQTDILFGLVRGISARRNDIKIIVMSATLDTKKFTTYFGCPSFHIPGRCYPVQVFYAEKTKRGYMKAAVEKVVEIHTSEPLGHVLVFLTGQDEIERACALLGKKLDALYEDGVDMPDIVILPMYAALTSAKQQRIFHETAEGCRKVVISTNICETSLTVDGIAYVVDPGFAKQKSFDATTGIDSLVVSPISKVAAEQRKGRAGRTREGKCYRLYTEEVFRKEIPDETLPEIQRTSLSSTALMLKSMKIDPLRFEYLDPPDPKAVVRALRTLWYLGALDDAGSVTRLGNLMNRFPLEPSLSKLLVLSLEAGVEQEILTIAAMLTVENIWINPRDGDEKTRAQGMRARFASRYGDHITFLCVYDTWEANRFSRRWCEENYIHFRAMRQAKEVRRQLTDILKRQNDALREYAGTTSGTTAATGNPIEKCLHVVAKCFFMNAARRQGAGNEYKPVADPECTLRLHPSSALSHVKPKWLVFAKSTFTTRSYIQLACNVQYDHVREMLPMLSKNIDAKLVGCSKEELAIFLNPGGENKQAAQKTVAARKRELHAAKSAVYERRHNKSEVEAARQRFKERQRAKASAD